jgi:branched-chain amino acid transport system substrate-binding protein
MLRLKFAWRGIAVLGVAALALGACADDGDGDGTGEPGATECEGTDLLIGTLLPSTGSLAFLGPPEFAGVDAAIQDLNDAGGVNGACVEVSHQDSGDTETDIASENAEALIQEGVHAVVGAASSGVSLQFIDRLFNEGIVQVSPANTSPAFTTHESGEFYFRTAPSDVLQGRVLADTILSDGNETLAILALQDAYGTGLLEYTRDAFESLGGEVVLEEIYDPNASEFAAEAAAVVSADPDAIALITFNEFELLAPELANAGVGPDTKAWYMVDGNLSNSYEFDEGFLEGVKGTLPGVDPAPVQEKLLAQDPNLEDYSYGPESYDATVLIGLAAQAAGSSDSTAIRDNMVTVSGPGGTACGPGADENQAIADCLQLLADGEDIDYFGYSGPIDWDEAGDLTAATIGIYQYGADNTYSNLEYRFGEIG